MVSGFLTVAIVIGIGVALVLFLNPNISLSLTFEPIDEVKTFDNGQEITIDQVGWNKQIITYRIANETASSINVVKAVDKAILSTEKFGVKFIGWNGAMNGFESDCFIPEMFVKIVNGKPDVEIILTNEDAPRPDLGGTTITQTNDGKTIQNTVVILYNLDKVSLDVAETITRHEFGHVLGLNHVDKRTDLMSDTVFFSKVLITQSNNQVLAMNYCNLGF